MWGSIIILVLQSFLPLRFLTHLLKVQVNLNNHFGSFIYAKPIRVVFVILILSFKIVK